MSTHETLNRHPESADIGGTGGIIDSALTDLKHFLARIPLPQGNITRFIFEVVLIGVAYVAYQLVRGIVEGGRVEVAFSNARALIEFERSLGFFWETQLQGLIIGNAFLIDFFNWIYIWGHLPVIGVLAIWIYMFRRGVFARYRNAFLISGAIGLVFFTTLPMAPPRFISEAGFIDTITLYDNVYHALQNPAFVNQYAAMPSLHLGWNLLVGLAIFETTKSWWARAFGLLLPIPMLVAIILTGNHFVLDAVAGVIVALAALWLAGFLNRRFAGTRIHAVLV